VRASDGTVFCANLFGAGVQKKPELSIASSVHLGGSRSCVIQVNNTLVCDTKRDFLLVPQDIGPLLDVALGLHHTCVIKADATIACWGRLDHSSEVQAPENIAEGSFTAIASSEYEVCAICTRQDGSLLGSRPMVTATFVPDDLRLQVVTCTFALSAKRVTN